MYIHIMLWTDVDTAMDALSCGQWFSTRSGHDPTINIIFELGIPRIKNKTGGFIGVEALL